MKINILGIPIVAVLLIAGACSSPAPTLSKPDEGPEPSPTTSAPILPPAPAQTPAQITPAPTITPAPAVPPAPEVPAPAPPPEGPMSIFGLFSPDLEFRNLTIPSMNLSPGQQFSVTVDATNHAVITTTYNITVYVDGIPAKSQKVIIDEGVTVNVPFSITLIQAGVHEITIGLLQAEVNVVR